MAKVIPKFLDNRFLLSCEDLLIPPFIPVQGGHVVLLCFQIVIKIYFRMILVANSLSLSLFASSLCKHKASIFYFFYRNVP